MDILQSILAAMSFSAFLMQALDFLEVGNRKFWFGLSCIVYLATIIYCLGYQPTNITQPGSQITETHQKSYLEKVQENIKLPVINFDDDINVVDLGIPLIVSLMCFLAYRGIHKDEELFKSVGKLR